MKRGELELRCFCSARPLLGVCGRDTETGDLYVWIKVFKQSKVYSEIVFIGGVVRIRCRECLRWHVVTIENKTAKMAEQSLPASIRI